LETLLVDLERAIAGGALQRQWNQAVIAHALSKYDQPKSRVAFILVQVALRCWNARTKPNPLIRLPEGQKRVEA
jgi:hypothetical protein